jgi:hypothetical protein
MGSCRSGKTSMALSVISELHVLKGFKRAFVMSSVGSIYETPERLKILLGRISCEVFDSAALKGFVQDLLKLLDDDMKKGEINIFSPTLIFIDNIELTDDKYDCLLYLMKYCHKLNINVVVCADYCMKYFNPDLQILFDNFIYFRVKNMKFVKEIYQSIGSPLLSEETFRAYFDKATAGKYDAMYTSKDHVVLENSPEKYGIVRADISNLAPDFTCL